MKLLICAHRDDNPDYVEHDRVRFILDYTERESPVLTLQRGTHVLMNMDREAVNEDGTISAEVFLGIGQIEAILEVRAASLLCILMTSGLSLHAEIRSKLWLYLSTALLLRHLVHILLLVRHLLISSSWTPFSVEK